MNKHQHARNFVPPAPPVRKIEILPPAESEAQRMQPPVSLRSVAESEIDRALGFTIGTAGLAFIVATGSTALIVAGWGVPFLSSTTLVVFLCVCALIWAGAWLFHAASSEGGIGLMFVILQYRLLRHEQKERFRRIERMLEMENEE
ncbi:MAG: hypothetical protein KatS3mg038_1539 [Candidatus Kapaibacterium sp.]|nr:MAG: hypothetical protein KatS3mg038_1539 [Candidatus Kapabacteria bacterium]